MEDVKSNTNLSPDFVRYLAEKGLAGHELCKHSSVSIIVSLPSSRRTVISRMTVPIVERDTSTFIVHSSS